MVRPLRKLMLGLLSFHDFVLGFSQYKIKQPHPESHLDVGSGRFPDNVRKLGVAGCWWPSWSSAHASAGAFVYRHLAGSLAQDPAGFSLLESGQEQADTPLWWFTFLKFVVPWSPFSRSPALHPPAP